MLVPAIQAGIDARDYWLLTLGEIQATIEAYNRNLNFKIEITKQNSYTTAILTAQFVGLALNGKPLPSYDECFGESNISTSGTNEEPVELWQSYKAQWTAYSINFNKRRRQRNKLGG